tara:strand:+ start:1192 stop:1416 length:225 start_codon:yes stop_codon:yes gene_type:complete
VEELKFRYANGLEKLVEADAAVADIQVQLTVLQPQLKIASAETAIVLEQVQDATKKADVKKTAGARVLQSSPLL